ncbi:MAG: hypothetical protein ACEQSF_02220 [Solirubrobacteraceae bacterium]
MNFKRKVIFNLLFLLFFLTVKAQSLNTSVFLNEIKTNFKNAKDITIDLTYSQNKKSNSVRFFIKKNKYLVIVNNEYKILFNGVKTYKINLEDKEVTVSSNQKDGDLSPNKILDLINNSENKIIKSDKNFEQVKVNVDKKSEAVLTINKKNRKIEVIKFYQKKIETSAAYLTKYLLNQNLPSNLFDFNKNTYKDFYITDLDK